MLIAAPTDSAIVQNDCDCACPAVPLAAAPARPLHEHMRLRLHPHAHFVELKVQSAELKTEHDEWAKTSDVPNFQFSILDFQFLLFIPSVLSGVVISRELRDGLLALGGTPRQLAELRAGMPQELIERCFALGILVDDQPPAPPPPSDVLVAWLHVTNECNLRCTYCYLNKNDEAM